MLGFDGSYSRDSTALVAATLDGFVAPVNVWERPEHAPRDWKVPRADVEDAIVAAMERFDVVELAVDPPGWASEIEGWREMYGELVVDFPTNARPRMAPACDRFRADVLESTLTHDGNGVLAAHVGHAVAKTTPYGTILTKAHPDSPRKIDAAVAAVVAYERAQWHRANKMTAVEPFFAFV